MKRALGVKEPTALVGGLVGVEEREPLPAVVVEERLNISCTVSRVGDVAVYRATGGECSAAAAGGAEIAATELARMAMVMSRLYIECPLESWIAQLPADFRHALQGD